MYADKRFDVELPQIKTKPSLTGFIAWLKTKPPQGRYDFDDCEGGCLMGQYMAYCGIEWGEVSVILLPYSRVVERVFRDWGDQEVLSDRPWTYGAALKRAKFYQLCIGANTQRLEPSGRRQTTQPSGETRITSPSRTASSFSSR
jgi:hypothetical protein